MITYAVGDVHGCLHELEQVLFRINEHHLMHYGMLPRKYVFLGDYVDRGPDSRGVVRRLMELEVSGVEVVFLRGNHEDMLLHDAGNFAYNGGLETLKSYGYSDSDIGDPWETQVNKFIPKEHLDWFRKTKIFYNDGKRTFVHAGIDRTRLAHGSLEAMPEPIMLWIRGEFLRDPSTEGGFVVHGHTPMENKDQPCEKPNRVNLDTGCVFGGRLTAAVFDDESVEPVGYIHSDRHSKVGPYARIPIIGEK